MSSAGLAAPPGYRSGGTRAASVVALESALPDVLEALRSCDSLHRWAERSPGALHFKGRAAAFGARLPGIGLDIVVRHAQHGGLLAPLTGDLFRWPSRAPWELEASLRLRAAGVPTPEVVAYVLYPAVMGFCRCDVATRRLPEGGDLPALWTVGEAEVHARILDATVNLLQALRRAGAVHEDLNVKNVYLARDGAGYQAHALDVDRVRFSSSDPTAANVARLHRSFRKAREQFGLSVTEDQLQTLERRSAEPA